MTGQTSPEIRRAAREAGISMIFTKPLGLPEIRAIAEMVRRSAHS